MSTVSLFYCFFFLHFALNILPYVTFFFFFCISFLPFQYDALVFYLHILPELDVLVHDILDSVMILRKLTRRIFSFSMSTLSYMTRQTFQKRLVPRAKFFFKPTR